LKATGLRWEGLENGNVTLNKVIEDFRKLPLPEREYLINIIEKQMIEAKRETISRRAKRAIFNLRRGAVKRGSVKDLYKDLELIMIRIAWDRGYGKILR
jgi:hypothetical protein